MEQRQKDIANDQEMLQSRTVSLLKKDKFSFKDALQQVSFFGANLSMQSPSRQKIQWRPSSKQIYNQPESPYIFKKHMSETKQYIPLGSIVKNSYLKRNQLKNLHFQNMYLDQKNGSSLGRTVFRHSPQAQQIRFYVPTFLRFHLIKLHSQDLKNITHIQNQNNMIIYINVYSKGLPKLILERLTKKQQHGDKTQDAELMFRANRNLYSAKYYTTYNDYLIFMFNPFSEQMIEFEIMKNVLYAPFEEAELILNVRINKKIFKLQHTKTLQIAKSMDEPISQISIQSQKSHNVRFSKVIVEFKIEEPKFIYDTFRFHKSIEFGNYGLMTNEISITIGSNSPPQKVQSLRQRLRLNTFRSGESQDSSVENQSQSLKNEKQKLQEMHQDSVENISSVRLSIGLYKHPVTQLCTFFIPLMLAGGLTLLMFNMCDHDMSNQLQVLAIILVAYGSFIPEFRERLSMSRTVIILDFFILYNMIPAILCALQSIFESRDRVSYNSYQIVSGLMYYLSVLVLIVIYIMYVYVERKFFRKYDREMMSNFDTEIFEHNAQKKQGFMENPIQTKDWFLLKQGETAYFCQQQQQKSKPRKKGFRRSTLIYGESQSFPPSNKLVLNLQKKVASIQEHPMEDQQKDFTEKQRMQKQRMQKGEKKNINSRLEINESQESQLQGKYKSQEHDIYEIQSIYQQKQKPERRRIEEQFDTQNRQIRSSKILEKLVLLEADEQQEEESKKLKMPLSHKKLRFQNDSQNRRYNNMKNQAEDQFNNYNDFIKDENQTSRKLTLQLKSNHSSRRQTQLNESREQEKLNDQRDYLYKMKAIQNQKHKHSFEKLVTPKIAFLMVSSIIVVLFFSMWLTWDWLTHIYNFVDLNRNCIHDHKELDKLDKAEEILKRQQELQKLLSQKQITAGLKDEIYEIAPMLQFEHRLIALKRASLLSSKTKTKYSNKQRQTKQRRPWKNLKSTLHLRKQAQSEQ